MRILLVRLRQIGDVVFTTPAVHAIRERYPAAHISYLVEPAAEAVVAGNIHINEVIVAPRQGGVAGLLADLRLGRQLRANGYDVVVDFHGGPRASTLAWLTGAPQRIGYDVPARGWMYTRRVPRVRTAAGAHSVVNQWALLRELGIPSEALSRETYPVSMPVAHEARAMVDGRLAGARVEANQDLIVIHVSAGNPFRRWPTASFAEVASSLVEAEGHRRVVVTAGPSDAGAAAEVIDRARSRLAPEARQRVLACGDFSLAELRALVDRASLYIGGDSGPMHVASTSRVPILAIYGPTLPVRSAPWRSDACSAEAVQVEALSCRPCDQRRCAPGDFRCLTGIDPRQVVAAAERLLAGPAVQ